MAAPTYFHSASSPADNGAQGDNGTRSVTPPNSMLRDDLVVIIAAMGIAAPTAPTISNNGGQSWTSATGAGANAVYFRAFWCVFNGTWSANPSVTFANESGTVACSVIMHVFRPDVAGVGAWSLDTAYAGASEASASPVVITGITPVNDDNVTLAGWLIQTATAITWGTISGAGWSVVEVAQYRNTSGTDISAAFAYQLQGTKAATGDVSLVPSTAAAGISFTMCWKHLPVKAANISEDQGSNIVEALTPRFPYKYNTLSDAMIVGSGAVLPDSFTGADAFLEDYNSLWVPLINAGTEWLRVVSNKVRGGTSGPTQAYYYNVAVAEAHYAKLKITLKGTGGSLGVIIRATTGHYYFCRWNDVNNRIEIGETVIGGSTTFWDTTQTINTNDVIELSIDPSTTTTVYFKVNGATIATYTNKTFTGGFAGLLGDHDSASNATGDDWEAGDNTLPTGLVDNVAWTAPLSKSFTDDFSAGLIESLLGQLKLLSSLSEDFGSTLADEVIANLRAPTLPINVSISDDVSLELSDSSFGLFTYLALTTEILTLDDLTSALHRYLASQSDDIGSGMSDQTAQILALIGQFSETVPTDDACFALFRFLAQPSDAEALSDLVAGLYVYRGGLSEDEGAGLTDLVTALQRYLSSFSDSVPYSDSVSWVAPCLASMSDTFVSQDAVAALMRMLGQFSDTVATADAVSGLEPYLGGLSDSVSLADLVSALQPARASFNDSFSPTDSTSALQRQLGVMSDAWGISDDLLALLIHRAVFGDDFSSGLAENILYSLGAALVVNISDDVGAGLNDFCSALMRFRAQLQEDQGSNLFDLVAPLQRHLMKPSELVSWSDVTSAIENYQAGLTDSIPGTDMLSGLQRDLGQVSDDASPSDNIGGRFNYRAQFSDSVGAGLADVVVASLISSFYLALTYSFADSEGDNLNDSMAAMQRLLTLVGEQPEYSDTVGLVQGYVAALSDFASQEDRVDSIQVFLAALNDYLGLTDNVSAAAALPYAFSEDIGAAIQDLAIALAIEAIPADVGKELTIVLDQIDRKLEQIIPIDRTLRWRYKYRTMKETEH